MGFTFAGRPCLDPAALLRECLDRGLPSSTWEGKANVYRVQNGREPGRGHLLLTRADLDAIDQTKAHDLDIFDGANPTVTLKKVTLLSAVCVLPGADADPDAAYLCEVADRRHHLAMRPVDKGYNLKKIDGTGYLAGTLNSGVAWTWQQVVTDLTAALGLPALALPATPHGTPENLGFYGGWAWAALNDVLDRLAVGLDYDPTADTFSLVRLGGSSVGEVEDVPELKRLLPDRVWDGRPYDPARAWRPEKVRVRFRRRPTPTGGTSPFYVKDITLAAKPGVEAGTFVQLDDDLTAVGATGTPSNSSALNARAQERADDWLRRRQNYNRPAQIVVAGHPAAAGKEIVGKWYGRAAWEDRGQGMKSEVGAGPDRVLERWLPRQAAGTDDGPGAPGRGRCGWLLDVPSTRIFKMTVVSASGRCGCLDTGQGLAAGEVFQLVYNPDSGTDDYTWWVGTKTFRTCCGCGRFAFKPNGDGTAIAKIRINNACDAADPDVTPEPFEYDLRMEGCGQGEGDEGPWVEFSGAGPKTCSGTAGCGCDNSFVVRVQCLGCCKDHWPLIDCTACRWGRAPGAYYHDTTGVFSGDYVAYNGKWTLRHQPVDPPDPDEAVYVAECVGGTVTVTLTLTRVPVESDGYGFQATLVYAGAAGGSLTYSFGPLGRGGGPSPPTIQEYDCQVSAFLFSLLAYDGEGDPPTGAVETPPGFQGIFCEAVACCEGTSVVGGIQPCLDLVASNVSVGGSSCGNLIPGTGFMGIGGGGDFHWAPGDFGTDAGLEGDCAETLGPNGSQIRVNYVLFCTSNGWKLITFPQGIDVSTEDSGIVRTVPAGACNSPMTIEFPPISYTDPVSGHTYADGGVTLTECPPMMMVMGATAPAGAAPPESAPAAAPPTPPAARKPMFARRELCVFAGDKICSGCSSKEQRCGKGHGGEQGVWLYGACQTCPDYVARAKT